MACVKMFIKLADPAYSSKPLSERISSIVEAFFRVFDSNGNGIIELFEVNEILVDVISGIAGIICTLVDHFEPYLLKVTAIIPLESPDTETVPRNLPRVRI